MLCQADTWENPKHQVRVGESCFCRAPAPSSRCGGPVRPRPSPSGRSLSHALHGVQHTVQACDPADLGAGRSALLWPGRRGLVLRLPELADTCVHVRALPRPQACVPLGHAARTACRMRMSLLGSPCAARVLTHRPCIVCEPAGRGGCAWHSTAGTLLHQSQRPAQQDSMSAVAAGPRIVTLCFS